MEGEEATLTTPKYIIALLGPQGRLLSPGAVISNQQAQVLPCAGQVPAQLPWGRGRTVLALGELLWLILPSSPACGSQNHRALGAEGCIGVQRLSSSQPSFPLRHETRRELLSLHKEFGFSSSGSSTK